MITATVPAAASSAVSALLAPSEQEASETGFAAILGAALATPADGAKQTEPQARPPSVPVAPADMELDGAVEAGELMDLPGLVDATIPAAAPPPTIPAIGAEIVATPEPLPEGSTEAAAPAEALRVTEPGPAPAPRPAVTPVRADPGPGAALPLPTLPGARAEADPPASEAAPALADAPDDPVALAMPAAPNGAPALASGPVPDAKPALPATLDAPAAAASAPEVLPEAKPMAERAAAAPAALGTARPDGNVQAMLDRPAGNASPINPDQAEPRPSAPAAATPTTAAGIANAPLLAAVQVAAPPTLRNQGSQRLGGVSAEAVTTLNAIPATAVPPQGVTSEAPHPAMQALPDAAASAEPIDEPLRAPLAMTQDAADAAEAEIAPEADQAEPTRPTEASQSPGRGAAQPSAQANGAQAPTVQPGAPLTPGLSQPLFASQLQAASGSPLARPTPTTPAQQIMPVLVTLAGQPGNGTVTVTLDPVELGRVEITVRSEGETRARVQVIAERPETLLLLMRDHATLDRALGQAGVGPEGRSLSFDLAADGGSRDGGRPDGEGGERQGPKGRGQAQPAQATEQPRRRVPTSALDIAV